MARPWVSLSQVLVTSITQNTNLMSAVVPLLNW